MISGALLALLLAAPPEPPSNEAAMARSCLLPGWGQRAKGETHKGWTHTGVAAGLLAASVLTKLEADRAREDYNRLGTGTSPEEFDRALDRSAKAYTAFQGAVGLTLMFWGYSAADAQFHSVDEIRVRDATLDEVFPALLSGTAKPLGSVTLENRSKKEARNVRVSLESRALAATTADVPAIPAGGRAAVKLVGTVIDVSEREATARLSIEWEVGPESRRARHTASVRIHAANVITWDDVRKIGPFVMPRDPTVRALATSIVEREIDPVASSRELALAAKVFDALGSTGVAFAANPRAPFSFFQGNADAPDTVSTPRETLARKSGDLPDLVALIASTMEGLGVRTALIELPGTLLLAVDVGIGEERDDSWIEHDGRRWIPLDPTALGASFGDASSRAAAMLRGAEKFTLVTISDAHAFYAPLDSTGEPLPVTIDETRFRVLLEADRARLAP